VPGGNHRYVTLAENPFLDGATYLVPRAGLEPTPRTDIGYRPVSQTRQTRRFYVPQPNGHFVLRGGHPSEVSTGQLALV
jgi:hypothetical protein